MNLTKVLKRTLAATAIAGALSFAAAPAAQAGVFVSVGFAPPAIPVYEQPLAPGYGYIWTPGYWAYGPDGYYWVDGAWVYPPYTGALWTPGYWDFAVGGYFWRPGYWGRTVGFYGGINYGFGYFGTGFWGGYWNGGHFFYNSAYNHIGFHNGFVYSHPVAGFNGRPGGVAFARGGESFNRGAQGFRGNEGSLNRGGNTSAGNRGGFNGTQGRGVYNPANTGQARGFAGGGNTQFRANPGAEARSFSGAPNGGAQARGGNFSGGQSRGFSGGGPGGGAHASSSSGGGGSHSGGGGRR